MRQCCFNCLSTGGDRDYCHRNGISSGGRRVLLWDWCVVFAVWLFSGNWKAGDVRGADGDFFRNEGSFGVFDSADTCGRCVGNLVGGADWMDIGGYDRNMGNLERRAQNAGQSAA